MSWMLPVGLDLKVLNVIKFKGSHSRFPLRFSQRAGRFAMEHVTWAKPVSVTHFPGLGIGSYSELCL